MSYIPVNFGASNLGNTSGATGTVSNQIVFAGGNNVTLSQSVTAGSATITISAGAGGAAGSNTFGMSNLGNTSGTSGTINGSAAQVLFAGGNNVTLSQSLNGSSATITISAGAGGAAGSNTFGMSNLGNTSGTSGTINGSAARVLFAGGNNVTLSQSLNGSSATLTISAASQTNQTLGLYASSNTTQSSSATVDARSLTFVGAGNLSVGASNGSLIISDRTSWQMIAAMNTVSWSSGGGQVNIAYYNATGNASFGVSNGTVLLSVAPNSYGVSNIGNTAGSTGTLSNQIVFAGGNNITLSQSTGAGGGTITISGGAGGAGGSNTFGMSNLGNTSGTSGTVNGSAVQFAFAGGNNVTLSQSINGSSGTITISAGAGGGGAQTLIRYQNMDRGASSALAVPVGTIMMQRLNQENDLFAGNMTVSTWLMNMSGTASTGASSTQTLAAHSTTVRIGIYTPVATANSVLTLINSVSSTFGSNATMSINPHYFGNRWLSIHSSQWSSAPAFTQGGDYVFAILINTSGASTGLSYLGQNYMNSNLRSGFWGVSTTTGNTTMPHGNYWNALYSASSSGLPGNISGNQVNRGNASAIYIPHIIMNNQYTY